MTGYGQFELHNSARSGVSLTEIDGFVGTLIFSEVSQVFENMARPERLELPTTWFEARYSIQLSYGRRGCVLTAQV